MGSLILAITFLLSVSYVLASDLLPFSPYAENPIYQYYYACGCYEMAAKYAINFESSLVIQKIIQSNYALCAKAVWCDHTELVHPCNRLVATIFLRQEGNDPWRL